MAFKGTRRRPNAQVLEVEIEDMGARLNAYTSREQTTFFADVQARHVPAALDVLSDILQHPRFPERAIQRERGVILREMEEVSFFHEFACLTTLEANCSDPLSQIKIRFGFLMDSYLMHMFYICV
jgi:mitochondrial-processing peptidase subunit beta